MVPAQRAEGAAAGSCHDGKLQKEGQAVIYRFSLG